MAVHPTEVRCEDRGPDIATCIESLTTSERRQAAEVPHVSKVGANSLKSAAGPAEFVGI